MTPNTRALSKRAKLNTRVTDAYAGGGFKPKLSPQGRAVSMLRRDEPNIPIPIRGGGPKPTRRRAVMEATRAMAQARRSALRP